MVTDGGGTGDVPPGLPYAAMFDMTPAPVLALTPDLVVLEANRAYQEAVGRSREEMVGRYMFDLFPEPLDPEGHGMVNVRTSMERARDTGRPDTMAVQRYDIPVEGGGFEERYWSPVHVPIVDEGGLTVLLLHRVEDVTDFVRERQQRQGEKQRGQVWRRRMEQAESDLFARARELQDLNAELREARDALALRVLREPMTNLLIRPVIVEYINRALAGAARTPAALAVLYMDLDDLKHVNDSYGHAAGDTLIRCFADHLRKALRPEDAIARVGGDEFVVLLEHLHDAAQAESVTRRVLEALSLCRRKVGLPAGPTASIGITVVEGGDSKDIEAEELISRADSAMYRAKRAGGSRYQLYDETSHTAELTRHRTRAELAAAVDGDQLRVHYQPIVDLRTGTIHALEALVRWQHPGRGLLNAGQFIDVAEEAGLAPEMGRWVIAEACRQLAAWDELFVYETPPQIFLNVSVAELVHPGLPEHLAGSAAAAGIDLQRLVVEITESGTLEGLGTLTRAVDPLLELGCELAIDDFGTGHSSLTRLVELPLRVLKIDRSFVSDVTRGGTSEAIVRSTVLLAHSLGLTVVAEGVEDAETMVELRRLGCDYAQGFHIAQPEPAAAITERLRDLGEERVESQDLNPASVTVRGR